MRDESPKTAEAASTVGETQDAGHDAATSEPHLALIIHHTRGTNIVSLFADQPLVLGRAAPADVILPDARLSRAHARFCARDGSVEVEDLGSRNGTWLNGSRLQKARIEAGAEVVLGATVVRAARFGGEVAAAVAAPRSTPRASGAQGGPGLIGGAKMAELLALADRVAPSRIPVLIRGETGTGKELMARRLHERGPRSARPLVCVNCAAIAEQLVESTLFGHERGAFTGALTQSKGVFEEADGGTLFLDEIGELPLPAQGALLRVLETGTFARVGSVKELRVDVRVVAATHRDLDVMARDGRFREDLCYRLNAVTLEVPPLRERVEDIAPLARFFLGLANEANGRNIRGITPEALRSLEAYVWPGNVRELRNAIDRALVMTRSSMIDLADLPEKVRVAVRPSATSPASAAKAASKAEEANAAAKAEKTAKAAETDAEERGDGTLRASIRAYEARMITQALRNAGGRRKIAARKLGMPLRSLAHKIKTLGVEVAEDDDDDEDASPGAAK